MQFHHLDAANSIKTQDHQQTTFPLRSTNASSPSSPDQLIPLVNSTTSNASTLLQQQHQSPEQMAVAFAENRKAHIAMRAMFELVHQYGDNLREGWKNVLDCLLYLLRADLLPSSMVQVEDFIDHRGHISLKERFKRRNTVPKKEESGLLSWLGFTGGSASSSGGDAGENRRPSDVERELNKLANSVVSECHPEQLVADSRYLASSALTELVNSIMHCSYTIAPVPPMTAVTHEYGQTNKHYHHHNESQDDDSIVDLSHAAAPLSTGGGNPTAEQEQQPLLVDQTAHSPVRSTISIGSNSSSADGHSHCHNERKEESHGPMQNQNVTLKLSVEEEEALTFLLELMVSIVLENRDRLAQVWPLVRVHLHWLLAHFPHNQQLNERAVVALIRIANRNLFRLGQHNPTPSPMPQPPPKNEGNNLHRSHSAQAKSVVIVVEPNDEHMHPPHNQQDLPDPHTIQGRTSFCADEVLHFMGGELLGLRPPHLFMFSRQIAFGLHALLRTNAANVHSSEHWDMFFSLLEAVGAAAYLEDECGTMVERNAHQFQSHTTKNRSGRRPNSAHHHNYHQSQSGAVQSDPEESGQTQAAGMRVAAAVDDRGYCSDEPVLFGESAGSANGQKSRIANPLLSTAQQIGAVQQLRLNKAESGDWIHVVPVPKREDRQVRDQAPHSIVGASSVPGAAVSSIPLPSSSQPVEQSLPNAFPQPQQQQTHATSAPICVPAVECATPVHVGRSSPSPMSTNLEEAAADNVVQPQPESTEVPPPPPPQHARAGIFKRGTVVLAPNLSRHDPAAFLKVCEILVFLARDAAHITPANLAQITRCLGIMVEASLDGGKCAPIQLPVAAAAHSGHPAANKQFPVPHEKDGAEQAQQPPQTEGEAVSEQERLANHYMDASLQLLNICSQLHARAATIYREWSAEGAAIQTTSGGGQATLSELWRAYWRPLLQAMARMSCDCRRRIRAQALDALGTAFRVPALSELMRPADWEDCFAEVLFPLLARLLSSRPPISPMDPIGMEEARIRTIQFTCKILLSNLTNISCLDTFPDLIRRLFDLVDQFLEGNACNDLLAEVIQESLKNCVLVFENFGVFRDTLRGFHGEMQERLDKLGEKNGAGALKMGM